MKAFHDAFSKISHEIAYNDEWANGTGYLDGAVKDVDLEPGAMARSTDTHGRNIIFVGTRFGTCVAFERFSPKENGDRSNVIVSNCPREARPFVRDGRMEETTFLDNFCYTTSNVGTKIEMIVQRAAEINELVA